MSPCPWFRSITIVFSTVTFKRSPKPNDVLTICFGCPRSPLLQRRGQRRGFVSSLWSASRCFTSVTHSTNFSLILPLNCETSSSNFGGSFTLSLCSAASENANVLVSFRVSTCCYVCLLSYVEAFATCSGCRRVRI